KPEVCSGSAHRRHPEVEHTEKNHALHCPCCFATYMTCSERSRASTRSDRRDIPRRRDQKLSRSRQSGANGNSPRPRLMRPRTQLCDVPHAGGKIEMENREIRAALDRHWAASDANDFEAEHQIYQEDAVLEYPQSGERIRGRHNIQASRFAQPNKKRFTV